MVLQREAARAHIMYYCDNMPMSASLARGWVTGYGNELRAHAERRGYHACKNRNDEIDHQQWQSLRMGAVIDNQWHEQRLSLTLIIPHTGQVSRVFRRRSTRTSKCTGQIQIQIRLSCERLMLRHPSDQPPLPPALCRVSQVFTTY